MTNGDNRKLELLSPAGSMESLEAAVRAGADAVYFGMGKYNARAFAKEFDARAAIEYCNLRGVKAHITFNTMLLSRELDGALEQMSLAYSWGAEAFIIQDIGLAALARKSFPDIRLHASTQMSVNTASGAKQCKALGFSRVVLARECSLEDVKNIHGAADIELEVFAHGAMCASVSGQCLMSSVIGMRSGNRGACAQPCRQSYALGGKDGYLLNMKDMCMLEHMNEIAASGARCIKLEGRMKRPEYVAICTRAYRAAIDGGGDIPKLRDELERIFNRGGFSTGCYYSRDGLTAPSRQGHWGVFVGKGKKGRAVLDEPVNKGDELASRKKGAPEDDVFKAFRAYPAGPAAIPLEGDIYKVKDAALLESALDCPERKLPLKLSFEAKKDAPCSLELAALGKTARVAGQTPQIAQKTWLDEEKALRQLDKLGDTPFYIENAETNIEEGLFLSASALNAVRRDALNGIARSFERKAPVLAEKSQRTLPPLPKGLTAQCALPEQAEAAISAGAEAIFVQPRRWSSLNDWQGLLKTTGVKKYIALPPVIGNSSMQRALDAVPDGFDGASAANIGQIKPLKERYKEVFGDYSLNAANMESVLELLELGLSGVTLSVELNCAQAAELMQKAPCLLTVYGTLPLMNLSSCPVRQTNGGCGGCDGGVKLKDTAGYTFTLLPMDVYGCYTQLLNGCPLDGLRAQSKLPLGMWKLNFYTETATEAARVTRLYKAALEGQKQTPLPGSTAGHFARGLL